MHPVPFEGSVEIKKPADMTDEECSSAWAKFGFGKLKQIIDVNGKIPNVAAGIDIDEYPYYMTAWQPNKEDLDALNRGEPVYVKVIGKGLPPMALFTLDEKGNGNFE
jgi:hypothetical protein